MGGRKSGLRTENRSFENGQFWDYLSTPPEPLIFGFFGGFFGSTGQEVPGNRATDLAPFPTVYSGARGLEPGKVVKYTMAPRNKTDHMKISERHLKALCSGETKFTFSRRTFRAMARLLALQGLSCPGKGYNKASLITPFPG